MGPNFTAAMAQCIIDAHEINMDEGEETDLLRANNPELAEAYEMLLYLAEVGG